MDIYIPSPAINIPIVQVIAVCDIHNMEYPVSGDHTVTMGFMTTSIFGGK